jgi:hypothetical protein
MKMTIAEILARPVVVIGRQLTVQGVVRTVCQQPFPHFTLEDRTGTLICKSTMELPGVGAHIEINGEFFVGIPEKCTVQMPLLEELTRCYPMHQRPCGQTGCEFETEMPRGWKSFAFAA